MMEYCYDGHGARTRRPRRSRPGWPPSRVNYQNDCDLDRIPMIDWVQSLTRGNSMPKLHIDTDLGGDIDDLCALAMVLNWPDAELLAVTTVAEHQGKRAGYVRYVLDLAGREDIPVAAGADVSLDCYRLWQGLPDEGVYWPEPVLPVPAGLDQALTLLERSIEQGAIIAAIGAFTNLALVEKRSPGILR